MLERLARFADRRLPLVGAARLSARVQAQIAHGGGQDAAANRQHRFGRHDRLVEVSGDPGERREKEVAEGVSGQPFAVAESVLEKASQQVLVVRQGDDAAADVAGRQYTEISSQSSR